MDRRHETKAKVAWVNLEKLWLSGQSLLCRKLFAEAAYAACELGRAAREHDLDEAFETDWFTVGGPQIPLGSDVGDPHERMTPLCRKLQKIYLPSGRPNVVYYCDGDCEPVIDGASEADDEEEKKSVR